MNLSIKKITENEFEVKVQAKSITFHQVTISEEFYLYLTNKKISKKTLLVFSFNFLLERENNSSIFCITKKKSWKFRSRFVDI